MNNFEKELFELGGKITAPRALTNTELRMREQKFSYVEKLSNQHSVDLRIEDAKPLEAGVKKVFDIMSDGMWYSVPQLRELSGLDQADRRMRQLKERGHKIYKQRIKDSRSFEYRLGMF